MSDITPEILARAIELAATPTPVPKLVELPPSPPPSQTAGDPIMPTIAKDDALKLAQSLLNGGVPLAEVQAALANEGYPIFGIENRSQQQVQRDAVAQHLAPAAIPATAYHPDYLTNGRGLAAEASGAVSLAAFNEQATAWCAEIALPPAVGSELVGLMMDQAFAADRASKSELEARDLDNQQKLARFALRQGITPEALVAKAASVLTRGGAFSDRVKSSGALSNPYIVMELALHADNVALASKLRSGK